MGEQRVQGPYAVTWGKSEPVILQLEGTGHTFTPPHPTFAHKVSQYITLSYFVIFTCLSGL